MDKKKSKKIGRKTGKESRKKSPVKSTLKNKKIGGGGKRGTGGKLVDKNIKVSKKQVSEKQRVRKSKTNVTNFAGQNRQNEILRDLINISGVDVNEPLLVSEFNDSITYEGRDAFINPTDLDFFISKRPKAVVLIIEVEVKDVDPTETKYVSFVSEPDFFVTNQNVLDFVEKILNNFDKETNKKIKKSRKSWKYSFNISRQKITSFTIKFIY